MKLFLLLCSAIVCLSARALAENPVRICTYHLLNYSAENEDGRSAQFKTVIEQIAPDILAVQDINGQDAAFSFFTDALDPAIWSLSTFTDGPDTDNMLYFKFDKFAFLDATHHPTGFRSISEYRLLLKATNDTITIISAHLTSGDTEQDAAARNEEATVIQTRIMELMQEGRNIVVCGNFNFYSTAEPGYIRLIMFNSSMLRDPVPTWVRNDEAFAATYTQSTRTTGDGDCGGGVGGGMDDRFDMMFFSYPLFDRLVEGSYKVYGNDGQPRLNSSINDPVNTAVSSEIAAALRCASDHLPVYADVLFDTPSAVEERATTSFEVKIYPMPVTEQGHIDILSAEHQRVSITVSDVSGRTVVSYDVVVDSGRRILSLPALPTGVYMCRLLGSGNSVALPFVIVR